MTVEQFEHWLREAFRYGGTERNLYCWPPLEDVFKRLLDEACIPEEYEVTLIPSSSCLPGTAYLVDPKTISRIPL